MSLRSADHTDQLNLYTLATLLLISPSFPFLFNMFLIFPCKGKITCFPRVPFTHILSHFQHTDIQHICRELSICVCWDHDLLCYCNTNNRKGAQKSHHSYWQPIPSEAGSTAPQFSSLPPPLLYVTLAASPWGQKEENLGPLPGSPDCPQTSNRNQDRSPTSQLSTQQLY